MMTCADARDALLEVGLAELRYPPASPLAEHLATCAACRRLAERIVQATDVLGSAHARQPRRSVDEAVTAARHAADRVRRTRRRWLAAVPALAAAGIAAVLLARGTGPGSLSAPSAPSVPSVPLVTAAPGNVAVIATANPEIVVIWQF